MQTFCPAVVEDLCSRDFVSEVLSEELEGAVILMDGKLYRW